MAIDNLLNSPVLTLLVGDLGDVAGVTGRKGKCRCWRGKPGTGKLDDCVCLYGSALNNRCVVIGMNAMAAC